VVAGIVRPDRTDVGIGRLAACRGAFWAGRSRRLGRRPSRNSSYTSATRAADPVARARIVSEYEMSAAGDSA
jgi:hypothetical protein